MVVVLVVLGGGCGGYVVGVGVGVNVGFVAAAPIAAIEPSYPLQHPQHPFLHPSRLPFNPLPSLQKQTRLLSH